MSWLWNAETEAHSLALQLTCTSCSQSAFLCKSALQAEPKARSLCPRTLSLAFLFTRCQLLRSLAVVLLRIASMHWQLNLALQSKSTQAAWALAWSQGYPASHGLPLLCRAAAACNHTWTQLLLSWQFRLVSQCCQAARQCVAGHRINPELLFPPGTLPQAPTACSALHPLPRNFLPSKQMVCWILVESQTWTREGNPNILWLSWYLGHANWLPKLW